MTEAKLKLGETKDLNEKYRTEKDAMRQELDKLYDQIRTLKDDNSFKYEQYSKQISQNSNENEEKLRRVLIENENLKEESSHLKRNSQQIQVQHHEISLKLENYQREYERYFEDNRRLKEIINTLRDEKENAQNELKRIKN